MRLFDTCILVRVHCSSHISIHTRSFSMCQRAQRGLFMQRLQDLSRIAHSELTWKCGQSHFGLNAHCMRVLPTRSFLQIRLVNTSGVYVKADVPERGEKLDSIVSKPRGWMMPKRRSAPGRTLHYKATTLLQNAITGWIMQSTCTAITKLA